MNAKEELIDYINEALQMLTKASIVFPKEATVNIYHHRGIEQILDIGAMFINIVNRDYCKSYVVMLPGQNYPSHYHRIKRESFYVLFGDLEVNIENTKNSLGPGEMLHVERGQGHSFRTNHGVVFEEISTMYVPNDSVYMDDLIKKASYSQRRTTIDNEQWKEILTTWNQ